MSTYNSVSIANNADFITLIIGQSTYRFHAVWLRDNALDEATRSASNGQRLITLLQQPKDSYIQHAEIIGENLQLGFVADEKNYIYPLAWLVEHHYDNENNKGQIVGWINPQLTPWGHHLQDMIPRADFSALMSDDSVLRDWLAAIVRYGFATLQGLPQNPDALFDVVSRFGFVRETNYGRVFEVRSEINPSNLAFTGLGLQAHTDNPYRDPVPTLQVLSCIENTVDGGESILVDGFQVAKTLQAENAQHFELLASYCANFRYNGDSGTDLQSIRPMIELAPDGELIAVRFNNRSAAPFTRIPFEVMADYYAAYRHFAEIVERQCGEIYFKLQAGELFIVDNTRIMHSRNAFSTGGSRWLRGCYADKDSLKSTLATL